MKTISSWLVIHAVAMLLSTTIAVLCDAMFVLTWSMTASLAVLIVIGYRFWGQMHPLGGFANHVTFLRFVLLIFALALYQTLSPAVFVSCIVVVMIADGIDGYLARKLNQSSQFGEIFDVEVDTFLALSLSFLIWTMHRDAYWILAAGILRYLFVVLYRCLRWQHKQRPSMPETKIIAVIFFASLLTPMIMQWRFAIWFVAPGCILVTMSFLRELYIMSRIDNNSGGQ
jgi:phosphatidylglycerophosphate synthase